jgi:LysM repeat protein
MLIAEKRYSSKILTILSSFILVFTLQTFAPPAYANTGVAEVQVTKTVTGAGKTLAVGVDGKIHVENPDKTWSVAYSGFRNGASDLIFANNRFYATSFFEGASSTDGVNWARFVLPLGERFNPGRILPDNKVFTKQGMNADQIQNFLNSMGVECRSGYVCLKDYRETTYDRAANAICSAYKGSNNERVADIIYKVSQACNVSVEVLIVMLQKEQGLVTHTWPSQSRYNIAMGYACPDTAPCDSLYFGFYNQTYNAARQLVRYSNPPGTSNFFTWYPVNKTSVVRWHPNASCGGTNVFIENQATASFYYYTPYQPNTAALVAYSGTGDSCSAYGNRNLWRLYHQWFNGNVTHNTFMANNGKVFVSVDMDGTVVVSSNGTSWLREPTTPVKGNEKVSNFYTEGENFVIALTNGKGYRSSNGVSWTAIDAAIQRPAAFTVGIGGGDNGGAETPATGDAPVTDAPAAPTTPAPETTTNVIVKTITHTVARGETVWGIASRYKTTVNSVVSLNNLSNGGALIFVGQKLKIEVRETVTVNPTPADPNPVTPIDPTPTPNMDGSIEGTPEPPTPTEPAPAPVTPPVSAPVTSTGTTHVVTAGETVWRIAARYNTTVANIVNLNNLPNGGALIFVGQRLTIASGGSPAPAPTPVSSTTGAQTHTVKAGDTLWSIAQTYKTTVTWLAANNNITNVNFIRPGMVLKVK